MALPITTQNSFSGMLPSKIISSGTENRDFILIFLSAMCRALIFSSRIYNMGQPRYKLCASFCAPFSFLGHKYPRRRHATFQHKQRCKAARGQPRNSYNRWRAATAKAPKRALARAVAVRRRLGSVFSRPTYSRMSSASITAGVNCMPGAHQPPRRAPLLSLPNCQRSS